MRSADSGIVNRSLSEHLLQLLCGQLLHIGLLLLPTFVAMLFVSGFGVKQICEQFGWSQVCFASGILIAAMAESLLVHSSRLDIACPVSDRVAMKVAMFVGTAILIFFWLAQIEAILLVETRIFAVQFLGSIMLLFGIVFRAAAIRALGSAFVSDIRIEGAIVRQGIYAIMRHPSEIGLLLIAIGGPLVLGAIWTSFLAAMVLIPISVWRTRRENAAIEGRSN